MSDDPVPILVLHGIAIRGERRYRQLVSRLNEQIGPHVRLIPVYWGDLGATSRHLEKLMGRYDMRSHGAGQMFADAIRGTIASGMGRALSFIQHRRGDAELAEAVRNAGRQIRETSHRRMRGFLNDQFQNLRLSLTSAMLPVMADTIIYQSPTQRRRIHQRVRDVMAEHLPAHVGQSPDAPLHVLAHSLGGVIAFDMAVADSATDAQPPLCIDHFVTLGSQPAFFHLMDPRPGVLSAFEGEPVRLPTTLNDWTNIWDEFDILGFAANEIFELHDGRRPTEQPVRCYYTALEGAAFFQSHLGYWRRGPAVRRLQEIFSAARISQSHDSRPDAS